MSAMNIRMFAAFIDTLNWRYNLKTKQRALKFPWDSSLQLMISLCHSIIEKLYINSIGKMHSNLKC